MKNNIAIYVACLAAYNNAKLHGSWIKLLDGEESVIDQIKEMLKQSPENDAEEWEIHDDEGFYNLQVNRYSISELCEIASMIAEAEKESEGKGKVIAYLVNDFGIEGAKECLEENCIGCFDSPMDFIYNYIEDCGILQGVPEFIKSYFDYESFLRDLLINDVFEIDTNYNQVYYFYNR